MKKITQTTQNRLTESIEFIRQHQKATQYARPLQVLSLAIDANDGYLTEDESLDLLNLLDGVEAVRFQTLFQ